MKHIKLSIRTKITDNNLENSFFLCNGEPKIDLNKLSIFTNQTLQVCVLEN